MTVRHLIVSGVLVVASSLAAAREPTAAERTEAWVSMTTARPTPIPASATHGSGPLAVLLLADLGADSSTYKDFAERHGALWTVHTLILPGGEPGVRPHRLERGQVNDPDWFINACEAVMQYAKERGIEKPVVIGHGVGGTTAYMLAIRNPDFARSTVVVGRLPALPIGSPGNIPSGQMRISEVDEHARDQLISMRPRDYRAQTAVLAADRTVNVDRADLIRRRLDALFPIVYTRYELEALYLDLRDGLTRLKTPLLIAGTISPELSAAAREHQRTALLNAAFERPMVSLEIFEGVRPWIIVDDPARLDASLLPFLGLEASTGAGAAPKPSGDEPAPGGQTESPAPSPAADTPPAPAEGPR